MKKLTATAIASLAFVSTSSAALLFYEGFSDSDYTAGSINGQSYVGPGYSAGGSWNTSSDFVAGGLTYSNLVTTSGFGLSRDDGSATATLDTTPGGVFDSAGFVGSGDNIGGAGITNSLYFSVLARRDATGGASFAGFQVYQGGSEGFGVGEVGGTTHKWLRGGSNGEIGSGTPLLPAGNTNFYVFRLDFDAANTNANGQVWINPDLSLAEGAQAAGTTTIVNNANTTPSGGFDRLLMRGGPVYTFDEIRIGTTWEDVTPTITAIPEPSAGLLAALGIFGLCVRRSRR